MAEYRKHVKWQSFIGEKALHDPPKGALPMTLLQLCVRWTPFLKLADLDIIYNFGLETASMY
jgi:hypothetical protein